MSTQAQRTQLSAWTRGASDEATCQECDWQFGPGTDRFTLYQARHHAITTRHVVDVARCWTRTVASNGRS